MSAVGRVARALPTMMRVSITEAIAYRAEMLVWVLATTMPFIMLVLWNAVAQSAPVVGQSGRSYGTGAFTTYFLSVFIVRQLVSSWAAWEMNYEVKQGTLAMRLLRPIHPVISYAVTNLAALPMRAVVTAPMVVIMFALGATHGMPTDWRLWLIWAASMFGGWLITFFANVAMGSLSLYMESSLKVLDVWLAAFFVFSGYLFPMDLFPPGLRTAANWLPFRYQIGLPTEIMTGAHDVSSALELLGRQYTWAAVFFVLGMSLWSFGVRRFQAFGG